MAYETAPVLLDDACIICHENFSSEHLSFDSHLPHADKNLIVYNPSCGDKFRHFLHKECWIKLINTPSTKESDFHKKCLICSAVIPHGCMHFKHFYNRYYKSPVFNDLKENPYLQVQLHSELKKLVEMFQKKETQLKASEAQVITGLQREIKLGEENQKLKAQTWRIQTSGYLLYMLGTISLLYSIYNQTEPDLK